MMVKDAFKREECSNPFQAEERLVKAPPVSA
jgi:hypothetical protein